MLEQPAGVLLDDLLGLVELEDLHELLGELGRASLVAVVGHPGGLLGHAGEVETGPGLHLGAGLEHAAHDGRRSALGAGDGDARGKVGGRQGGGGVNGACFVGGVLAGPVLGGPLGGLDLISEACQSRN
jgi:hypothetical protein